MGDVPEVKVNSLAGIGAFNGTKNVSARFNVWLRWSRVWMICWVFYLCRMFLTL
jgi:hypothetical protein